MLKVAYFHPNTLEGPNEKSFLFRSYLLLLCPFLTFSFLMYLRCLSEGCLLIVIEKD